MYLEEFILDLKDSGADKGDDVEFNILRDDGTVEELQAVDILKLWDVESQAFKLVINLAVKEV